MTQVESYQPQKSWRQKSWSPGGRTTGRKVERFEMKLLVLLTYPLFLAVVALARLGLKRARFAAVVSERPPSLFAEARQAAEATIASAFRG